MGSRCLRQGPKGRIDRGRRMKLRVRKRGGMVLWESISGLSSARMLIGLATCSCSSPVWYLPTDYTVSIEHVDQEA